MENVAEKLYNILGTKFDNTDIKTLDSSGKETTDMEDIEMFSFEFIASGKNYGPVVILLSATENLEVYYGDNTSKSLDPEAKKKWENLVEHLSTFARSNRLGFSLKHTTSLKYDLSNITDITESFKNIFEGYYGTKKTSYNKQGNAKIIIKHSKSMTAEDARFRNISSLFVENADGERFKLPFTKLAGARAMARHVTEGGNPYDLFGLHISEMVNNINTLGGFVRRSKTFMEDEGTAALVETGRTHYTAMRKSLKQIAGKRGYGTYKEGWEPSAITEQDTDVSAIRKLFTEKSVNSRIEEALPLLAKLQQMAETSPQMRDMEKNRSDDNLDAAIRQAQTDGTPDELERLQREKELGSNQDDDMNEVNEFAEWADTVVEGTWSVPDSDDKMDELIAFLGTEQPLGVDAMNVTNKLYHIIGDDDLFDTLAAEAQNVSTELDARPIVINWIKDAIKRKDEYKDPSVIDRMLQAVKNAQQNLNNVQAEGCNTELDADNDTQLTASVNKDVDNYIHKDKKLGESEGSMTIKNLTPDVAKRIVDGSIDIYNGIENPEIPPNDQQILQREYDVIAAERGYAPDDDFEQILDQLHSQIHDAFGAERSDPYHSIEEDVTDLTELMDRTYYLLQK